MKKLGCVALAILLFSAGCTEQKATVTVTSIGAKDSLIYLSLPIENFPLGVTDTIVVKDRASRTIEVPIRELSRMDIRNGNQFTSLIIEPGEQYEFTFDYSKEPVIEVNDSSQMMMNRVFADHNFYKYEFVSDYTTSPLDTMASRMMANFESLIATDKEKFVNVEMSKEKRAHINSQIELFWMASLSKVLRANHFDGARNGKKIYGGYTELWKQLFAKYPINGGIPPSEMLFSYAKMMLDMQSRTSGDTTKIKTQAEFWKKQYDGIYREITDPELRKTILAHALYLDCMNNSTYEKAMLEHIARFDAEFPDNPYRPLFDTFATKITDFNTRIESGFSPEMKFVENGDSIKTLNEVISTCKGRAVFIDFWFTGCHACIEEFAYKAPLHKFLKENNIELLYFSIDQDDKTWHNSIKFYELDGTHIRADIILHTDIYETHKISWFPHYMLVDADGNIAIHTTKLPSQGQALYDQIKEALK